MTAQLKADRCTTSILLHSSQEANTPTVTSLSPSHHQWKAVRSGQPARRGPRTSSIFSRIQPLSRRRATSSSRAVPGLIRHQVYCRSTSGQHPEHPHASQAAVSPTYLSRHLSAFASRMQVLDQQIELIVTASVGPEVNIWRTTRRDRTPLRTLHTIYTLLCHHHRYDHRGFFFGECCI